MQLNLLRLLALEKVRIKKKKFHPEGEGPVFEPIPGELKKTKLLKHSVYKI